MDPAKAAMWQRFYDRVLSDKSWPRELWFAAVEDALKAALPQGSRLVEDFQTDVAELTRLERAASGSYHDEKRIGQLEAQIGRLLDIADQTIRQAAAEPERRPEQPARPRWGLSRALAALGVATLLVGAGWSGATYYYEFRLAGQVERQLQPYVEDLRATLGEVQADLTARREATNRLSRRLSTLQDELTAKAQLFDAMLQGSRQDLVTLREEVVADLEQRLLEESGDVVRTLGSLRQRADGLGRGFDEVGKTLSTLRERVPDLGQGINGLAEHIAATEQAFERTASQMAGLAGRTARPAGWSPGDPRATPDPGGERSVPLGELSTQIAQLKGEVDRSRQSIEQLHGLLDHSLERAKLDGMALETAVREARSAERQLGELMTHVTAAVETTHHAMQVKIEQVLVGLAEQADRALQQSEDTLHQAEAEASHKVGQAGEQALAEVERSGEEQLAALAIGAGAMRAELDEARAGLLARWEHADQDVNERQTELMADLDRYAEVLEARVQEFLEAVEVIVAQIEPQPPAAPPPAAPPTPPEP